MYLLRALSICGTIVLFSGTVCAQAGKETAYWNWTEPSDFHKSMVQVKVSCGNGLSKSGSGSVVEGNRVVTAAHVLDGGLSYEVTYFDGSKSAGSVVNLNTQSDVGILKVQSVSSGVTILKVARKDPEDGSYVEICGFGGNGPLRHFSGHVGIYNGETLGVDAYVISGDSGGAALNESGELIGVVSGGMCWSGNKFAISEGVQFKATWPVRCGGLEAIRKALK